MNRSYKYIKTSLLVILTLLMVSSTIMSMPVVYAEDDTTTTTDGTITIDETTFPDENFRQYVIDEINNGETSLDTDTIDNVTEINVASMEISDLTGIEYFTNLKTLYCFSNSLTTLDVSSNTNLSALSCGNNQLTELDVSNNTSLTWLNCYANQLTTLDLSNNTKLITLYCGNNSLESLDISNNNLITLECYENNLESLDLSSCTSLTSLNCYSNSLTSLDISSCTNLSTLKCSLNSITSLELSSCTQLKTLECYSCGLETLDLSNNTSLTSLTCWGNSLTTLDLSNNTELVTLYCDDNQLESLDVSTCSQLETLYCGGNNLTELDISACVNLDLLECVSNELDSLDVSACTSLTYLGCIGNNLSELNVSNNTNLYAVSLGNQDITIEGLESRYYDLTEYDSSIDASRINDLEGATLSGNALTGFKNGEAITYTYDTGYDEDLSVTLYLSCDQIDIESVILDNSTLSLENGSSSTLTATIEPEDTTDDTTITWTSSDTSVATVSSSGKVTAVGAGSATITATTSNDLTATCKVTVYDSLSVTDPSSQTIKKGKSATFTVEVSGGSDSKYTYQWYYATSTSGTGTKISGATKSSYSVTGSSSNNGRYYYCVVSNGQYSVTSERALLTVNIPITKITLNKTSLSLSIGGTSTLSTTITPSDTTSSKTLTWSSSNTSVATVSSKGKVTAKKAGTATITVKTSNGKTATCKVTVKKYALSSSNVSVSGSYTYNGKAQKATVKVTYNGKTLKSGTDYSLSYSNNKNAGTATVKVTGKGNYSGTVSKNYKIAKKNVSKLTISSVSKKTYTGSAIKPSVTVKDGSTTLKKGTSYTVSYSNNKSTGKASIKITGKGNYTGTKTIYFYIVPKTVSISSTSSKTNSITVKWKKCTGASGYQIAYSTSKNSGYKTVNVSSSNLSKTISGLSSNKTYYVKVRAYKTVSGTKHYGSYSSIKSIKTTKDTHKALGQKIANYALGKVGCTYKKGGSGPNKFDAAGLVVYCHKQAGVSTTIKQNVSTIATLGTAVSKSEIQPGDTVIYSNNSCGIYVGDGKVVMASSRSPGEVIKTSLGSYSKIRRIY